ncbi:unnamed protein product [Ambrosiozyma monospora]|uniref:Unnamed protein product n=1 Tax=Ambrosiozyma monospora TaxID=43982 RepID=A0A9W6YSK1_AMBMO|nr:unnamed protein product [Ambrosiozyma monospora]
MNPASTVNSVTGSLMTVNDTSSNHATTHTSSPHFHLHSNSNNNGIATGSSDVNAKQHSIKSSPDINDHVHNGKQINENELSNDSNINDIHDNSSRFNNNNNNNQNQLNSHNSQSHSHNTHSHSRSQSHGQSQNKEDEEVIPTAIVIKNIPFAIKKEQLLDVMSKLNLPLPYAFNYHFDNGVFRGLAFANFNSTEETSMVVSILNGREIGGRKLRVEYKKMLPLHERERIEREKREKRGQLEEQHRSASSVSLASLYSIASASNQGTGLGGQHGAGVGQNQQVSAAAVLAAAQNAALGGAGGSNLNLNLNSGSYSFSGSNNNTSKLLPERLYLSIPPHQQLVKPPATLDFNNPETLDIYTKMVVFKDDTKGQSGALELAYSINSLSNLQKRNILAIAQFLNLFSCEVFDQSGQQSSSGSNGGLLLIRREPLPFSSNMNSGSVGGIVSTTPSGSSTNISGAGGFGGVVSPLIRSHSHSMLNSVGCTGSGGAAGLSLSTGRYRQQSPRIVSGTSSSAAAVAAAAANGQIQGSGAGGLAASNLLAAASTGGQLPPPGSLSQQQQQQSQSQQQYTGQAQPSLRHSSSTASLNLLRSNGYTPSPNTQQQQQQQSQTQQQQGQGALQQTPTTPNLNLNMRPVNFQGLNCLTSNSFLNSNSNNQNNSSLNQSLGGAYGGSSTNLTQQLAQLTGGSTISMNQVQQQQQQNQQQFGLGSGLSGLSGLAGLGSQYGSQAQLNQLGSQYNNGGGSQYGGSQYGGSQSAAQPQLQPQMFGQQQQFGSQYSATGQSQLEQLSQLAALQSQQAQMGRQGQGQQGGQQGGDGSFVSALENLSFN